MAALKDLTVIKCCTDEIVTNLIVDDPTSAITTGNTYTFTTLPKGTPECYTVLIIKNTSLEANALFTGDFTSCEECLSGIKTAVSVVDCIRGETFFIDINTFSTLPTIGDVYYLTFYVGDMLIENCFTIECYGTPEGKIYSLNSISDSYTGCTECLYSNVETYAVTPCITSSIDTYYVNLPLGFDYTNYIINFTNDAGDSICGVVYGIAIAEPTGTLISILGLSSESGGEVSCEDCLAISNEKRIITNCLTGNEAVVWGSTFFEGSEVTNLSTSDGCFEVGDLTESAVTISTYLDYSPQPDCQECIQCNGVIYEYSSCTNRGPIATIIFDNGVGTTTLGDGTYGPYTGTTTYSGVGASFTIDVQGNVIIGVTTTLVGVGYQVSNTITITGDVFEGTEDLIITVQDVTLTGSFLSYQYVQNPIGKTTYIPYLDDCVEITSVLNNDGSNNYTLFSFDVFDSCTACTNNEFFVWKTEECSTGSNYIVTVSSNSFTIDDYVKVKWGTTDFQCHKLLSPYIYEDGNLSTYKSETITPFDDCTSCNSGTLIGASIVKCGGGGHQFVNIPIDIWNTMSYLDTQLVFVTENYGQCYILLNNCPLEPNYTTIYPIETYYNCITCYLNNTRFPRSAGTESFICLQVCTESGTTVVSVVGPHPEWTDAYGTQVTQLDMFTLGGPNGLNN